MSSADNPQYNKWCETLRVELKEKSKTNVEQRMRQMVAIVNTTIPNNTFSISATDAAEIMQAIDNQIDAWRGVEIGVCKNKEKKDFCAYQATARNWFNRNKAKIYGNHLFYTLIFRHILKHCATLNYCDDKQKIVLFIDIFLQILSETVQFPRTKLQPLMPHQALMQTNEFKKACKQFTSYYDMEWTAENYEKRDRDRAKKTHLSFKQCLERIKDKIQCTLHSEAIIPYPFEEVINSQQFEFEDSDMKLAELRMFDQPSGTTESTLETVSDCMPMIEPFDEECSQNQANYHCDHSYSVHHGDYAQNDNFNQFRQQNHRFNQRVIPRIQAPNMNNFIPSSPPNYAQSTLPTMMNQQRMQYQPFDAPFTYGPKRGSSQYVSRNQRYSPHSTPTTNTPLTLLSANYSPMTPVFEHVQYSMPPYDWNMDRVGRTESVFDDPLDFAAGRNFDFNDMDRNNFMM